MHQASKTQKCRINKVEHLQLTLINPSISCSFPCQEYHITQKSLRQNMKVLSPWSFEEERHGTSPVSLISSFRLSSTSSILFKLSLRSLQQQTAKPHTSLCSSRYLLWMFHTQANKLEFEYCRIGDYTVNSSSFFFFFLMLRVSITVSFVEKSYDLISAGRCCSLDEIFAP